MIKVALFDVGGVLVSSTLNAISKALSQLGLTEAQIDEVWNNYINSKLGCGLIDEQQFWQSVCSNYRLRSVAVEENLLGKSYAAAVRINNDVLTIVRSLKERGLTLAILSDTIGPHAQVNRDLKVFDNFDHLFLSHEIGCRKPDVETFTLVVSRLNVRSNEVVFIDDRDDNVQGAIAAGMHGILYHSATQLAEEINRILL